MPRMKLEPERDKGYSTLQVDDRVSKDQSEKQVAVDGQGSLPEANNHGAADANLPYLVCDGDAPEVYPHQGGDLIPTDGGTKKGMICGMRRKTFRIVLVTVIVVIIGAAVGGVGGVLSSKSSDSDSSNNGADSRPSSGNDGDNSARNTTILEDSSLASVNYTDEYGYANYLVFYQLRNTSIYQSAWNSSNQEWIVSQVSNSSYEIKENTPLAANVYWFSDKRRDLHLYYLDPNNVINGFTSGNASVWVASGVSGRYTASNSSRLACIGKECADCYDANYIIYQDSNDALQWLSNGVLGWSQEQFPKGTPNVVEGSGMALGPVYGSMSSTKWVVLYVNSGGSLLRMVYNGTAWANETLPTSIPNSAAIAAFSVGYNGTDDFELQVLTTRSRSSSGGVSYTSTTDSGLEVNWSTGNTASLGNVMNSSGLAANQAGRVYGLVADIPVMNIYLSLSFSIRII
ncbi:hypothetical protein B0J12DRAFT_674216, partial [Macrophomina phaseolina]